MSPVARPDARLLFRVDPLPGESPRGYLCRVAHEHRYGGPLAIAQIAGLPESGLALDDHAARIAHLLRLDLEEWRALCYRRIKGRTQFHQRLFCGQRISPDDLNYKRPRICPRCLNDAPFWRAVWDLGLVTTCPIHRCHLLNQCPACKRGLAWQRPAVHECRCGLDLGAVTPEVATGDLVAINAAIYRAAGLSPGVEAERDLTDSGFPPEMLGLRLGALLRFVLFIGAVPEQDGLRRKRRAFASSDLVFATEINRAAAALLREWPRSLRETLLRMLPPGSNHPAALNFKALFGNFYRHLFRVLPRSDFGFLHDVFETFVIEDWKGLVRRRRHFSAAVRRNSFWVAADEAERVAGTGGGKIRDAVREGGLEAAFVTVRGRSSRTECWIRRDSLNRWIGARDAQLALYMSRPEAERALGLRSVTVARVAAVGAMRYVEGPEQNFPPGFFFLREDVMRIRHAFDRHAVPQMEYSRPGQLIALRQAMTTFLGCDSGLAAVIRAVVDGHLAPVGYTNRFRGITGYLFPTGQLREYRPHKVGPEVFLNFREAAAVLGITRDVVSGLVQKGLLPVAPGHRNGLSKLIPEKEIQHFAENYVATSVLARGPRLNGSAVLRHLKESGTSILAIQIDARRRHACFLPKHIATQITFPPAGC